MWRFANTVCLESLSKKELMWPTETVAPQKNIKSRLSRFDKSSRIKISLPFVLFLCSLLPWIYFGRRKKTSHGGGRWRDEGVLKRHQTFPDFKPFWGHSEPTAARKSWKQRRMKTVLETKKMLKLDGRLGWINPWCCTCDKALYIYICIADNMWECMFLDWVLFMILKGSYCLNIHVLGHAWVHKEIFRISTKVSSR